MSTTKWDLARDLAFYDESGLTNVGISLRKLEAAGLEPGTAAVVASGVRVTNLLGLGFDLTRRDAWAAHQERLCRAVDAAAEMGAECLVLTTGSAGSMSWEEAAEAFRAAASPVIEASSARGVPFAIEHTNSLRVDVGFVHTLRDVVDLARMLSIGVVMESNACWGERGLDATIAMGIDVIRLVQVSDFVIGTLSTPDRAVPGDGDIPLPRILKQLVDAGYRGVFDLELIGPRIEAEGYGAAIARSVDVLTSWLSELGV
jgi:sugar phosphate isomerase/epimerase